MNPIASGAYGSVFKAKNLRTVLNSFFFYKDEFL